MSALEQLVKKDSRADTIFFFVPYLEQNLEESSPLQGFTPDLYEAARTYARIALLPKCLHELLSNNEQVLAFRIAGEPHRILPVELSKIATVLERLAPIYACILSVNDDIANIVKKLLPLVDWPILHISPDDLDGITNAEIGRSIVASYVTTVLERQEQESNSTALLFKAVRESIIENHGFVAVTIPSIPRYAHLTTEPNQAALQAVGLEFAETKPILSPNNDNGPYFDAILSHVDFMLHIRSELGSHVRTLAPYGLVLTSPAVLKRWRGIIKNFGSNLGRDEKRQVGWVLRQIIGRSTYRFLGTEIEAAGFLHSEPVKAVVASNRQDLEVYTAALSVRAGTDFVPTIRLPTAVNNVFAEVRQLENTARNEWPTPRRTAKLSKWAKRLSLKLVEDIPESVIRRIQHPAGVKLISDSPLEWLNIDGFPLALHTELSRIPVTPGNLFFQQTAIISPLALSPQDFDEVLIIRAFSPTDHLREYLTSSVKTYEPSFKDAKPRIRFVDVQKKSDLIKALEGFSGSVAVFDGHGRHRDDDDIGYLQLPAESVSAWELRNLARIPPIIILGACDTHPMSASHVTTANGFLAAGAKTVVGTSLPIDAATNGMFIARLLLRISRFIPILLERGEGPVRWSRVVSGMLKRQYMTEVLFTIASDLHLKPTTTLLRDLSMDVGIKIDQERRDWLQSLPRFLAEASSKPEGEVLALIQNKAYITDALAHVQFGNPEHIAVVDAPRSKALLDERVKT
jgi:hypothetical protein